MSGDPDDEGHKTMGSPNWALPPTPCQAAQFANWVWTHSWQRVGTDYLVHNCFHGITLLKGSRKKCNFFTFSQDVRVSRSPLLLVRVLQFYVVHLTSEYDQIVYIKKGTSPTSYTYLVFSTLRAGSAGGSGGGLWRTRVTASFSLLLTQRWALLLHTC